MGDELCVIVFRQFKECGDVCVRQFCFVLECMDMKFGDEYRFVRGMIAVDN